MSLNIDLQYFPNVYWFKKAIQYKHIEINASDRHAKMSFRNRIWVAGADGRLNLSVPIAESRNEKQLYKDVRIVPGNWATIHFRTLSSCYNRSPWFEHFRDELAVLYNTPFTFLFDWNLASLDWINRQLGNPISYTLSPAGWHPPGGTRRVPPGGRDWSNFFRPGNEAEWLGEGGKEIRYPQVFEERTGFLPGLSILDLLFCEGPAALSYLT